MCLLLGDFLRLTLKLGGRDVIPLAEELALVEQFLAIERVRFGARLTVERAIDPSVLDCLVPPLLLQPLVENAVTHGIATLTEGGTMRITAERHPVSVTVVVENPCDPDRPAGRGTSVGLANVKARLATLYDGEANVSVNERDGWFRVELRFPVTTAERPAGTPGATGEGTTPGATGEGTTPGATEIGSNRVAQDAKFSQ
jgi:two-component system, LytTR family, sensor histidine kinase AlgZ